MKAKNFCLKKVGVQIERFFASNPVRIHVARREGVVA